MINNQSLAVTWRPKCLQDVVGQDVLISVLSKQIETGTFKNAYLFAGPSGCGKTSVARIMATLINNKEGEPIEIDAASNNGVDSIRQLIVDSQQTAIESEYKIYIIDECHMLTTAAWNAALKLLEEPPTHAIFIFCTTNPEKIPETIISRVQRFDFLRINHKDIADRLEFILNEEYITTYERVALDRIAIVANGFMREAISLLEKCIGYSNDITLENVEKVLGLIKYDALFDLFDAIVIKNNTQALTILNSLKTSSPNLTSLFDNIIKFVINCAKYQKTHDIDLIDIPKIYLNRLNYTEDFTIFMERLLKYRQLNFVDFNTILDIAVLELCRR